MLWISLSALILVSCTAPQVIISPSGRASLPDERNAGDTPGPDLRMKVLYGEKELAGRMILKKTDEGVYKVAFFNELGMTYLDGTYTSLGKKEKFTPNTIAPYLDRKAFLKNFEKALGGFIEH